MLRQIEIVADGGYADTLQAIAEQQESLDCIIERYGDEPRVTVRMLMRTGGVEPVLDAVQQAMGGNGDWRAVVLPIEATVPKLDEQQEGVPRARFGLRGERVARAEILNEVVRGARLDLNFVVLALLSTIVVAIGMITDNIAVVIGAMVIAPLLGPNLAFAFATAIGDRGLMLSAVKTNAAGVTLSLGISIVVGLVWTGTLDAGELLSRTQVGLGSIALALAAGAAAVLSLTTGISSALVGVMVAVALLPPAAAFGIMLGAGRPEAAVGAFLLLAVNVVAVNLAAQIVFALHGVRPRTWAEQQKARAARRTNALGLIGLLAVLAAVIVLTRIVR